jgi:CAAX prenyl protease-like protein
MEVDFLQVPGAENARAPTGAPWRILPFAVLIALLALEQALNASPWASALDARWLTVARGLLVGAVLLACWPHYIELRGPGLTLSQWIVSVATGLAVFAVWIVFDRGWAVLGVPGTGFVPLDAQGRLDPWLYVLRFAGFAIAVPLAEELFWRSFLLRWIDKRRFLQLEPRAASPMAFAICSVLFAAEHAQWFAGLVAGIIYTGVYTKTGNLRAPIVSHAITNAALAIFILATRQWPLW